MVETDAAHRPVVVGDLDRDWLLHHAAESEYLDRAAARRKLRYALRWAELNPATDPADAATLGEGLALTRGGDSDAQLAGEGTPWVAAGAAAELGAALQITTNSAAALMGHALELYHRLPRTWAQVEELEVPAWKARRLAAWTRELPPEAATWVDEQVAPVIGQVGLPTLHNIVLAALAAWCPDLLAERERKGRAAWHVSIEHDRLGDGWDGTSALFAYADTGDLTSFADLVDQVVTALAAAGDHDPVDHLRAKALGVIGRGEHHDLLGKTDAPTTPCPRPRSSGRAHQLHLHVTRDDLADHVAGDLTVRPVADLARADAVDQHDPPEWMREVVILRDGHCVFPHCQVDARTCDLDHIDAYRPHGPPGQTSPSALACLCRRHHNAKTHHGWRYHRTPDGTYLWTSPHGRRYAVTELGTISLSR